MRWGREGRSGDKVGQAGYAVRCLSGAGTTQEDSSDLRSPPRSSSTDPEKARAFKRTSRKRRLRASKYHGGVEQSLLAV